MDLSPATAHEIAGSLLALLTSRAPTLGRTRVLSVDGPSGSGKSTLAAAVADLVPDAVVIRLDDLYDGWGGLRGVGDTLRGVLGPLGRGEPSSYRRYDWTAGSFVESVPLEPVDLIVLDGVGSGHRAIADLVTVLVWIDVEPDTGRARALARDLALSPETDPGSYEDHLLAWQEDERRHFGVDATRDRADIVLR